MASTYLTPCFSVSIVNFEQVNDGWVWSTIIHLVYPQNFPKNYYFLLLFTHPHELVAVGEK